MAPGVEPDYAGGTTPRLGLPLDAKARLTAGAGMWTTHEEPRLGIRALRLADGPNGVRGYGFDERATAWCTPCGAALAATWDVGLAEELGEFIAEEALRQSVDVVLGPVLNLLRSPLGGRNFECLSEDPLLSGSIAAAWITGVQRHHVGACPKHFVGNDAETSRTRVDCVIDERALHEIYLAPFEIALRAHPWTVMAAYNRVNGTYASEHAELLRGLLKDSWGSDALVVSDWTAVRSTVGSAVSGLDLEMPGPARHFGSTLARAVRSGEVPEAVLDDKVARLARLSHRTPPHRRRLVERSGEPPPASYLRREPPQPLTRAAAASFVLLKNDANLLPLQLPADSGVLAVLGPNAVDPCYQGWGSSYISMGPRVDPVTAIAERFLGTRLIVEPGCTQPYSLRRFNHLDVRTPDDNVRGAVLVEYFRGTSPSPAPGFSEVRETNTLAWDNELPLPPDDQPVFVRARATLRPAQSGGYTFSVQGSGPSRILVNDQEVAALPAQAGTGDILAAYFSDAVGEGTIHLPLGTPVRIAVEMVCEPGMFHLLRFGCRPPEAPDQLDRAVAAARAAEAAVLIVGTSPDIETESRDRDTTSLPGPQDELVDRILDANPSTAVIVNAGRAVDMPWATRASTILYSWLPGHAFGPALAAVLAGDLEPGGRLPVTIAASPGDYPAYDTVPDRDGKLHYRESCLVGYRGFDAARTSPAFCFGHGIGYTDFSYEHLTTSTTRLGADDPLVASVVLRNVGTRNGREVVQLYVSRPAPGVPRAPRQLAAFAAVDVPAGQTVTVDLEVDARRLAYWDDRDHRWRVEAGDYVLQVGRSSRDLRLSATISAPG